MVRRILAVLVFVTAVTSPVFSQGVTAKAFTDTTDYLVGDYVHYTIQVDYKKGLKVYPPSIGDSLRSVSLLQTEKPLKRENARGIIATYNFVLSGYDSAAVKIPQIPVFYQAPGDTSMHYALTNNVGFTIRTVAVNLKQGIKDVNPPIKIPLDWRWILLWIVIALLVAGTIYYFFRRYKRRKQAALPTKAMPKIPLHVIALNSLHELEEQKLWQKGQIKEYHSAITEIIRRYFEGRFDMPALELPTSEAVELLRQRQGSEPIIETTYNFLSNADMVKFAKFIPLGSVNEEMMKQAYEIVNRTAPAPAEEKKVEMSNVQ